MTLQELHIVCHSHTDRGFTHDAPIANKLHRRHCEQALKLIAETADNAEGERFAWTVETWGPLAEAIEADDPLWETMREAEQTGALEAAFLPWHYTPLLDATDYQLVGRCASYFEEQTGLKLTSAMSCDVNGHNWPLVDALADRQVQGLSMAINTHFGRTPPRPVLFRWASPSGQQIPVFNGFPYGFAGNLGLGGEIERFIKTERNRLEDYLASVGYEWSILMVQAIDRFGDNGPAPERIVQDVIDWNRQGERPRLILSTPRRFWERAISFLDQMPVLSGDWTDSWNFGSGSTARHTALHRRTRQQLRAGRLLGLLSDHSQQDASGEMDYLTWAEHTWTADCACESPASEDALIQSIHKAALLGRAFSTSKFMQREGLAALAARIQAPDRPSLVVFNPLPFEREISGLIPGQITQPRGGRHEPSAGRHAQDRKADYDLLGAQAGMEDPWRQNPRAYLSPTIVPALGYRVVAMTDLWEVPASLPESDDIEVTFAGHRLRFDREKGGLTSWTDSNGIDWLDPTAPFAFGQRVHESVDSDRAEPARSAFMEMPWTDPSYELPSGWKPDWPARRRTAQRLLSHRVRTTPLGLRVDQVVQFEEEPKTTCYTLRMPPSGEWLEWEVRWTSGNDAAPEANYLSFPFRLSSPKVRIDSGTPVEPGIEQLAGVATDYFTVQEWVDFEGKDRGITVATPEQPMVQIGGFHFARQAPRFTAEQAWLLGWVTNNYWECNFPVTQPGEIRARYRFSPYQGIFEATRAQAFGMDAANNRPLVQAFEGSSGHWPEEGRLLDWRSNPAGGAILRLIEPGEDGSWSVVVQNVAETESEFVLSGALLPVLGENFRATVPPRRTVRLIVPGPQA